MVGAPAPTAPYHHRVLVPEGFVQLVARGGRAFVRADLAQIPTTAWWADGDPLPGAKGRGRVTRTEVGGLDVVLRTYRRGGSLRRVLPDAFRSPTRALRELQALATLRARGVPAVEPVAAVARRRGLLWELRLATVRVPDALPLPDFVARRPGLRREAVRAAGRVVARAFAAGMIHPDLHPDNFVARAGDDGLEIVLLDLDRAMITGEVSQGARDAMLVRMARYLLRHRDDLPIRPSATDLLRFLDGLGLDRAARRRAMGRLGQELARQAARRNLPMPSLPGADPAPQPS